MNFMIFVLSISEFEDYKKINWHIHLRLIRRVTIFHSYKWIYIYLRLQWFRFDIFKYSWKSLIITKIYCYLECLVYIKVQSLQELDDHWHLKISIVSCFSQQWFKQIQHAFIIQDFNTSLKQSENFWWFRVEFLTSTVCKVSQKYWALKTHLAVNECMIFYFEHI